MTREEAEAACREAAISYGHYLNTEWERHIDGYEFTLSVSPSRTEFFSGQGIPSMAMDLAEQCMKLAEVQNG
jgi:hypothetical protein